MQTKLTVLLLLIVLGCTEPDNSTTEDDNTQVWAMEAELMAHRYCNSLRAPTEMRDRFLVALSGVRDGWSHAIPELDAVSYFPPWKSRCVSVHFTAEYSEGTHFGVFPDWDSLNHEFAVDSIGRVGGTYEQSYTRLLSDSLYNVEFMAAAYSEIEGIEGASPCIIYGDHSNIYPHLETTYISLLFRKAWGRWCLDGGCENNIYWYFKCYDDSIDYIGVWDPSSMETPDWWEEAYENIIEFQP